MQRNSRKISHLKLILIPGIWLWDLHQIHPYILPCISTCFGDQEGPASPHLEMNTEKHPDPPVFKSHLRSSVIPHLRYSNVPNDWTPYWTKLACRIHRGWGATRMGTNLASWSQNHTWTWGSLEMKHSLQFLLGTMGKRSSTLRFFPERLQLFQKSCALPRH